MSDGGTQKGKSSTRWSWWFKLVDGRNRQIRFFILNVEKRVGGPSPELTDPILSRKASKRATQVIVPQTDTGRQGENPKALERTLVKELGKITP